MADTTRLESILEAEAKGYSAFLTRLPLKLALIKRGQVASLERFLAREAEEQQKLRAFERDRAVASAELAAEIGLPTGAPLSDIIDRLPAASRVRLAKLREALLERAARLREGNERCELLLSTSLEFVKYSMEVIGSILNPEERLADMLYGPEQEGPAKSGSVLLNRTA
ncbi:MAG: flagellar protein FlgN [Candidatus Sericytochromatia bacterium]|nr:flagellar protein FlgN [Candidatus Tanganyikabacteria bacterium]